MEARSAHLNPILEIAPAPTFRTLVTEQLRNILDDRSLRIAVVGILLVFSAAFTLVEMPTGIDSAWMFIVPVAISAIAAGLREGLVVATAASVLCALYSLVGTDQLVPSALIGVFIARFALYGLMAAVLGAFAEAHASIQADLQDMARLDPLTKVANVSGFYEALGLVSRKTDPSFAVVVVDVDDLKVLNDRHGHQVGSSAIQRVAQALEEAVRATDCVARFGGDEFVLILNDADLVGAEKVIERVRDMLAREGLPGAPDERVSVSVGVALYGLDGASAEDLLELADVRMYIDKRSRKKERV